MHDPLGRDLRGVIEVLREPVTTAPDLDARVMAAVRALPVHRTPGVWARIMRPRRVTIHPARMTLLAAAALLAVSLGTVARRDAALAGDTPDDVADSTVQGVAPASVGQRRVQFVLVAPTARKVAVVGDFNGWDPTHAAYRAHHQGGGVWAVTASVPVGHHRYAFVVDDSVWVADPTAPRVIDDDYGLPNSAIVVGESTP